MLKYLMLAVTLLLVSVASCSWVDRTSTTIKNEIGSELSTTKEKVASLNIGIVQGVYCDLDLNNHACYIYVLIEPTNAEANQTYIVSLYERGVFRQMNTISWNQPEINIKQAKYVHFDATDEEYAVYSPEYGLPYFFFFPTGAKSLSSVFSIIIAPEESSSPINEISSPESKLNINPQQVSINQPVSITTKITTVSNATTVVTLLINGQIEQTKMVKDCPQGCLVNFIVTKPQTGVYAVAVGGQKGSFIVK